MKRSREPFLWALFSGGGMLAAMLMPALILVLWLAPAYGWGEGMSYEDLRDTLGHPLVRLVIAVFVTLCLFHWAHRFRFTLYDGLQLYHLNQLVAVLTYGAASVLSVLAAYQLWMFA